MSLILGTLLLALLVAGLSVWAAQGIPLEDDWCLIYARTPDGRQSGFHVTVGACRESGIPNQENATHSSDGIAPDLASSLIIPWNDGVYPLARALLRTSWDSYGSLVPIVLVNVLSCTGLAVLVLTVVRRRTGCVKFTDIVVPLCCLNPSLVPSFTWASLVFLFLSSAALVPLAIMMVAPSRNCGSRTLLFGVAAFLMWALANGVSAYTYGLGIACWCMVATFLLGNLPMSFRLCLGMIAGFGAIVIIAVYFHFKTSHGSLVHLTTLNFVRVFVETLSVGLGGVGASSRGALGAPLLAVLGFATWELLYGESATGEPLPTRFLSAATLGVVLMPCVGIAVARESGITHRYMPYGIPVMIWLYVVARTRLSQHSSVIITSACAVFYGLTFLYDGQNAWQFAKQRRERAVSLLADSAKGPTPMEVASRHAAHWFLNDDEGFAKMLSMARSGPMFGALADDRPLVARPIGQSCERWHSQDGWTYRRFPVDDATAIAACIRYKPLNPCRYQLRWNLEFRHNAGVPVAYEESSVSFRGNEEVHVDYLWLPPGTETIWFGIEPHANPTSVHGFLLQDAGVERPASD